MRKIRPHIYVDSRRLVAQYQPDSRARIRTELMTTAPVAALILMLTPFRGRPSSLDAWAHGGISAWTFRQDFRFCAKFVAPAFRFARARPILRFVVNQRTRVSISARTTNVHVSRISAAGAPWAVR